MTQFDNISPLDYRYVAGNKRLHKSLSPYLSEEARIQYQAKVEAALAKALAKHKICSSAIAKEIAAAAEMVKAEDVYKEEKKIKHDVRALANVIRSKVSKQARPYVHFSATSYDIVDTASALRYKEATEKLIIPKLKELEKLLIKIALREKKTLQIGRTHGQHAEPITFGFFISEYVVRLGKRIKSLHWHKDHLPGKFSGAVGAYNSASLLVRDPQALEKDIMNDLGLVTADYSKQIVEPEPLGDLLHVLVSTFSVLANFADDMRNLQRSEIAEVAESFGKQQVGSSTMPHKRNPINFENVKSLWKEFMPRAMTFYMDQISEHQRDLTNSASARFIPELFAGLYVSADRLQKVCDNLYVDRRSMHANFAKSRNAIIAEPLYILLAKHGHPDAHEYVLQLTMKAKQNRAGLADLAFSDARLQTYLDKFTAKERRILLNPEEYTGKAAEKTEKICKKWKKELKIR